LAAERAARRIALADQFRRDSPGPGEEDERARARGDSLAEADLLEPGVDGVLDPRLRVQRLVIPAHYSDDTDNRLLACVFCSLLTWRMMTGQLSLADRHLADPEPAPRQSLHLTGCAWPSDVFGAAPSLGTATTIRYGAGASKSAQSSG
jgi:hypothetical protein